MKKLNDVYKSTYLNKIVVKEKNKYFFVKTHEIKFIKSSSYYAEIYTLKNAKYVHRISSMGDLYSKLNPNNFLRVNRSSIINLNEIKEVVSEGMGDFSIVMNDNTSFSLSKKYKKNVLHNLEIKQ